MKGVKEHTHACGWGGGGGQTLKCCIKEWERGGREGEREGGERERERGREGEGRERVVYRKEETGREGGR